MHFKLASSRRRLAEQGVGEVSVGGEERKEPVVGGEFEEVTLIDGRRGCEKGRKGEEK